VTVLLHILHAECCDFAETALLVGRSEYHSRSSTFRQKFLAMTPIFWHVFGRAPSDLQLCFVQLKTLAPSARYSTFKYPVTLKRGLGVTQGHRKLYKKLSWCWNTCATRLEVSQGHQT